jgi:hypothetical protein
MLIQKKYVMKNFSDFAALRSTLQEVYERRGGETFIKQ